MDFTSFRHSEELSDIEIVLQPEDRRYSLHKFPLYTKSEYVRELVKRDPNLKTVELRNFPGGTSNFERVIDFCYSHYIEVNRDNVLQLYLAGLRLSMRGLGNLVEVAERQLTDILTSAKLTRNIGQIIAILIQFKSEIQVDPQDEGGDFVNEVKNKCIDSIIEIWSKPPSRFPYKRDRGPNIQDLETDTVRAIIRRGKESEVRSEVLLNVIREYTERYMKPVPPPPSEDQSLKLVLPPDLDSDEDMDAAKNKEVEKENEKDANEQKEENSGDVGEEQTEQQQVQQEAPETVQQTQEQPEEEPQQTVENVAEESPPQPLETEEEMEERERLFSGQLEALVVELPEKPRVLRDENSVKWIIQALEIANRKQCECRDRLLYAASTVLTQIPEQELRSMSPELVCDLLEEAGKSGFHFANTVSVITDFYILDKAKEGKLDKETFIKLASALPEGFRTNVDTLYEAYGIMSKECTPEERDGILGALDLSRLNEETIGKAYENDAIDAGQAVSALISRCKRLGIDLEKAKEIIKKKEDEQYFLAKTQTRYYPSSTSYLAPKVEPVKVRSTTTTSTSQVAWPLSARWDTRYDPIKLSPSKQLPTHHYEPDHQPVRQKTVTLVRPTPSKSVHVSVPLSARYSHEKPQKQRLTQPARTTSLRPSQGQSISLPSTPRNAWTKPQKGVHGAPLYVNSDTLPDYSSSGIGPEDVRQVMYDLALTSPRLSYMYSQYDVPERDYHYTSASVFNRS